MGEWRRGGISVLPAGGVPRASIDIAAPVAEPSLTSRRRRARRSSVFAGMRVRMVAAHLLLLVGAGVLSMIGTHELLQLRLDRRTDAALRQELLEVPTFLRTGIDPLTGDRFTSLERAFDVYLDRNIPSVEEAFIALVGGDVYRDRLRSFPGRAVPAGALATWSEFSTERNGPEQIAGSFRTAHGTARYRAVRTRVGEQAGAFVVAILPAGEQRENRELQTYGVVVVAGVVLVAAGFTWLLAGRVLAPVRELTETAQLIFESDQSERIATRGSGEAAEMGRTFNDMLDRLNAASASQLEFLNAAGHELRAPLTVATGHLELLAEDAADQQTTLALVLDELTRMGRIVDDLQSLAGANAPGFVTFAPIDAHAFANELLAKAAALAPRDWRLDARPTGAFAGDRFRLTEAVLNLADNAVKNTQPGDTIAIGLTLSDDDVRLWVRDTGVGVAPGDVERIFERFARGTGAHRRYRGAGLGLSIVQSIAEAHGGRVDLRSHPGEGATFTIVLPRRPVAAANERPAHAANLDR
jgi:signal transduction histidine kinase